MQKPCNNAKAFGLSQVVHKHWELKGFRKCDVLAQISWLHEHKNHVPPRHVHTWLRLCVHTNVHMIALMCTYTYANDYVHVCICAYTRGHDCAYVCIYVQAWSRLCVHICAGMIVPMCAYTCRHDHALCVHICAGMIAPMCAYRRGHDHAYVCIFMQAWLRLCVHTGVGMIVPMCAYTCMPDCTYVTCGLVGMKILRANKTRPNVSNLRDLTLCMHICVQACICTILGHKVRHQVWASMATIRRGLAPAMF